MKKPKKNTAITNILGKYNEQPALPPPTVNRKFIKLFGFFILLLLALYLLPVFVSPPDDDSLRITLYFLSPGANTLMAEHRNITPPASSGELISETITELVRGPETATLARVFPRDEIIVLSAHFDDNVNICAVDLSARYNELSLTEQLYCKNAIVLTLTEFEFINGVVFSVENNELMSARGAPAGIFTSKNTRLNPELSPLRTNMRSITLYFLKDGELVQETRTVEVPGDIEHAIVEQLIQGPRTDALPTLNPDLKLKSTNTTDGICYVDFGPEFLRTQLTGTESDIFAIYSIINSLTELNAVGKVQILSDSVTINETIGNIDLSIPLSREE